MSDNIFGRLLEFLASLVKSLGGFIASLRERIPTPMILLVELGILITLLLPRSLFGPFNCEVVRLASNYQSTDGFSIDNQVIVMGTRDALQAVEAQFRLTTIEGCDLSYLNTRRTPDSGFVAEQFQLFMRLYELPTDPSLDADVYTITRQINAVREQSGPQESSYVFANPNYLTRSSDSMSDPCGLPNSGGGGSGGTPYGDPYILDPNVYDAQEFKNQWAFGSAGINFIAPSGMDGRGVRIAVFDTSPYRITHPFFKRIGLGFPSPMWLKIRDDAGTTLMSNHGLFAAGLIHRIAPRSRIQVIRVLNDDGCGQIWVLHQALEAFTRRSSAWSGNLNKTVINMSLGIRVPSAAAKVDMDALEREITRAEELGAIIIAAAGNDSPGKDEHGNTVNHMPMQIPADYPNVIGVAASRKDKTPSCYSNQGDVAAPGGNGGRRIVRIIKPDGTTEDVEDPCAPRTDNYNGDLEPCASDDAQNCEYGVISLGQTRYGPRYIYWSGTSFATPLVSGMAALAYEGMDKETVICLIQGGKPPVTGPNDPLGTGIINIGDLTNTTILSQC